MVAVGTRECITCGVLKDEECFTHNCNKRKPCRSKYEMGNRVIRLAKNGTKPQKYCHKCRNTLCADQFNTNRNSADGLQGYCKPCTSEYMKKRAAGIKRKQTENCEEIATCLKCTQEKPTGRVWQLVTRQEYSNGNEFWICSRAQAVWPKP